MPKSGAIGYRFIEMNPHESGLSLCQGYLKNIPKIFLLALLSLALVTITSRLPAAGR